MTTISVEARSLRAGDWIEGEGEATTVSFTTDGKVFARVGKTALLYRPEDRVQVRLEDARCDHRERALDGRCAFCSRTDDGEERHPGQREAMRAVQAGAWDEA
jgi:hypothetical protein